jgi:hypothetical protein
MMTTERVSQPGGSGSAAYVKSTRAATRTAAANGQITAARLLSEVGMFGVSGVRPGLAEVLSGDGGRVRAAVFPAVVPAEGRSPAVPAVVSGMGRSLP